MSLKSTRDQWVNQDFISFISKANQTNNFLNISTTNTTSEEKNMKVWRKGRVF